MNHITKTLATLLAGTFFTLNASAQANGSNSSYSRFGLGMLSDQGQGFNRNMGGVAQGMRSGNRLNMLNPASYSAIDSLAFIFDAGMSLQRTRMSQEGTTQRINNTSIDYVHAGYRIRKGLGMSIGFLPFTNIGYSFSQEQKVGIDDYTLQPITKTSSYSGSGGLHQLYAGLGWNPIKGFSIGFNLGYMWGNINHAVTTTYAENGTANANYNTPTSVESASLQTWACNVGIQYQASLGTQDKLTLGATVGIGHTISGDAILLRYISNGDSIPKTISNAYQMPMTYSAGASWLHQDKWVFAADYSFEKWSQCKAPTLTNSSTDGVLQYEALKGSYTDRSKISIGAEYTPQRYAKNMFKSMTYRAGAYYSTPYLVINGQDGPKELCLTAGIGIPIINRWNNRSYVNVGAQWIYRSPSVNSMITENYFRLNIGVTFNDMWFEKWKFK